MRAFAKGTWLCEYFFSAREKGIIIVVEQVLLLNITYEPLKIINWQRAISLLCLGKVEVIEESNREIRSVSIAIRLPSVVRLLKLVKRPRSPVKFSRQNIYARDQYRCQYCDHRFSPQELTYDHILPKSRGGRTVWENIVTCCIECNRRKGGRTPAEASMVLLRKPIRPKWVPAMKITISFQEMPRSWRDYLSLTLEIAE
jgi:5-methylcytosine-specific restriction endonuclease McrA